MWYSYKAGDGYLQGSALKPWMGRGRQTKNEVLTFHLFHHPFSYSSGVQMHLCNIVFFIAELHSCEPYAWVYLCWNFKDT